MRVFIATDIDEEIDDQCALEYIFRNIRAGDSSGELVIMLVSGKPVAEDAALALSEHRLSVFWEYFPELPGVACVDGLRQFKVGGWEVSLVTMDQWSSMKDDMLESVGRQTIDVFLQIAPLCGVPPTFFKQHIITQRVLMGDFEHPEKSINGKKTWMGSADESVWTEEFEAQEAAMKAGGTKIIWIGTDVARKIKFSPRILDQLPVDFKSKLMDKAFEQFVGRIHPHLPYCMGVSKGANLPTCLGYFKGRMANTMSGQTPKEILDAFKEKGERFWVAPVGCLTDEPFTARDHRMLKKRIAEQTADFVSRMNLKSEEEREEATDCFSDIAWIVAAITDQSYFWTSIETMREENVFSMKNLENVSWGKARWKEWVELHQCDLTPCYDLSAAQVAAALIVGDGAGWVAQDREVVEADIPVIVACLEG
jgi:hypothetical protein